MKLLIKIMILIILLFSLLHFSILYYHSKDKRIKELNDIENHINNKIALERLNSTLKDLHNELHIQLDIELIKEKKIKPLIQSKDIINLNNNDNNNYNIKSSINFENTNNNNNNKRAVLFTMDSITSYEDNSKKGGAAGEILIRHSLETAFKYFNISLDVMTSDSQFDQCKGSNYDYIILDPWTWAAKGWVPKSNIKDHQNKIYILDFFGTFKITKPNLKVPLSRYLTAYESPWNTFLGYYISDLTNELDRNLDKMLNKEVNRKGIELDKELKKKNEGIMNYYYLYIYICMYFY